MRSKRSKTKCAITRRRFIEDSMRAATVPMYLGFAIAPPAWSGRKEATGQAIRSAGQRITVGIVQQAREPDLGANRDKIVRFTGQAKARGCRLVIFPEDALGCPVGTSNEDIERAVDVIRDAARSNDVYVIFCAPFAIPGFAPDKRGHCLRVIAPDGRILRRYNKLICNIPPSDPRHAPGVFYVDDIPCCAMICADRWLRGVEELPVTLGAKILIDCSANARKEWIPEFAWYLPVTRALRNNVWSIFCNMGEHPKGMDEARHGHSAIIHPDGRVASSADDAGDQMLVATLDLSEAHGAEARRRHNHSVFKPYWDLGRRILQGEKANITLPTPYTSPKVEIKIAAAQRRNSAFAVGPDGSLLTRYDQMVVDRRDLFEEGTNTAAMWFNVKGVPAIVTIGSDARWNEIGELAAVRGAQLLFNLSYGQNTSDEATLLRTQFWVQLASFYTFSATVNAADPRDLAKPSAPASGGSSVWVDFEGHKKKPMDDVEVFSQYSACRIVSAGQREEIIYAKRAMPKQNMYFQRFASRRYPYLNPWYHQGARAICGDT